VAVTSKWPVLALLCAASFIAVLDTTIVAVALPSVQAGLGFSAAGAPWLLNGYAVVFGGLLLFFGRLADRAGRRRLFALGLLVFAIGSAVAGAATEPWVVVVGRFVQGAGAAAFVPASLSLLTTTFPKGRERSRALSAYGAMVGLGFVSGMVGGGLLTEAWGWRWVFWVNVPAALLVLALSRVLPEPPTHGRGAPLDLFGALLLTTGTVLVLLGLTSVPQGGGASGSAVVIGGLGLAALAGFVVVERRHAAPLVPLAVVLRRKVLVPNAAVTLESMVGMGWLYLLSLYFQQTRGLGPLETGLLFVPMTLASVVGAVSAGWASPRWGLRWTATAGLTLVGLGLLVMVLGVARDDTATIVVGMVAGETGFMLANVPLTLAGTAAVDEQDAGLAAGVLNTSMQLGGACGLAVVAVVAATVSGTAETLSTHAIEMGLLLCLVAFCLPAVALALAILDRDYQLPERQPAHASS
jgi:EmrB/QacA subfamily drug resistance transporter